MAPTLKRGFCAPPCPCAKLEDSTIECGAFCRYQATFEVSASFNYNSGESCGLLNWAAGGSVSGTSDLVFERPTGYGSTGISSSDCPGTWAILGAYCDENGSPTTMPCCPDTSQSCSLYLGRSEPCDEYNPCYSSGGLVTYYSPGAYATAGLEAQIETNGDITVTYLNLVPSETGVPGGPGLCFVSDPDHPGTPTPTQPPMGGFVATVITSVGNQIVPMFYLNYGGNGWLYGVPTVTLSAVITIF